MIVVIVISIMHHQLDKRKHSLISNSKHGTGRNFPEMIIVLCIFFIFFSWKIHQWLGNLSSFLFNRPKSVYWKKDLFSSRANNKHFLSPKKHFYRQRKHKNECFRKINSRKPQCRKTKIKDKINRKKPRKKVLRIWVLYTNELPPVIESWWFNTL